MFVVDSANLKYFTNNKKTVYKWQCVLSRKRLQFIPVLAYMLSVTTLFQHNAKCLLSCAFRKHWATPNCDKSLLA